MQFYCHKRLKKLKWVFSWLGAINSFFVKFNFVRLNFKRPCILQLSQLINSILFEQIFVCLTVTAIFVFNLSQKTV